LHQIYVDLTENNIIGVIEVADSHH